MMIEKNELSNDNTTRREVPTMHLCHGNIFNLYLHNVEEYQREVYEPKEYSFIFHYES